MRLLLACLTPLIAVPAPAENDAITIAAVSQGRELVQPVSPLDREIKGEPKGGPLTFSKRPALLSTSSFSPSWDAECAALP
jgi:hypothetical protein